MGRKLTAELVGTFWLVLGGCGTAVLAGEFVGFLGVAFAFGLTVLTGAYFLGHISGGHFNPAVTIGLFAAGKADRKDVGPYVIAQVVGAVIACAVLAVVANGVDGFDLAESGFAANGFADHSPNGYSALAGFVTEFVLTAVFLMIILGATREKAPLAGGVSAPIAIGLGLTLIHLISIPVTNTSVNPARSFGPAVFVGDWAMEQLWMFWVAPIAGAVAGAALHKYLLDDGPVPMDPATEDEAALAPRD
ncbi:aquaporin Z [Actinospongicola halichondriae]|uniref:aquaporin Z n=1 Tax=Actinospongicola halichondriae TaxID=3236844 RepID=UPI003D51230C